MASLTVRTLPPQPTLSVLRRRADELCELIAQHDSNYTPDSAWEEALERYRRGDFEEDLEAVSAEDRRWNDLVGLVRQINQHERRVVPGILLIGFTGKKGCGKNEAALVAQEHFGIPSVAFADPLRKVCKEVFRLTDDELSDRAKKEAPLSRWPFKSPREIMQLVGTDMFRAHFPEVWIEHFKHTAREYKSRGFKQLAITDVRFPNEANAIRQMGGVIIRIDRPANKAPDKHVSETEIDRIIADYRILNDADLDAFKQHVLHTLSSILK